MDDNSITFTHSPLDDGYDFYITDRWKRSYHFKILTFPLPPNWLSVAVECVDENSDREPYTFEVLTDLETDIEKAELKLKAKIKKNINRRHVKIQRGGKPEMNKHYLHKLIVETDDENILSKVQAYFTTLKGKNIDWWDTISSQEKEAINTGLQQLENGEGVPHEEVKRKADKLLGRQ